jgi:hypothetical protein
LDCPAIGEQFHEVNLSTAQQAGSTEVREIGCGDGHILGIIAKNNFKVRAVIYPKKHSLLQGRNQPNVALFPSTDQKRLLIWPPHKPYHPYFQEVHHIGE